MFQCALYHVNASLTKSATNTRDDQTTATGARIGPRQYFAIWYQQLLRAPAHPAAAAYATSKTSPEGNTFWLLAYRHHLCVARA